MDLVEWLNLELIHEEICRAMGLSNHSKLNPYLVDVINKSREYAFRIIKAKCIYMIVPVTLKTGGILLNGSHLLSCKGRFFEGASHAAIALVTIGTQLEEEVSRLFSRNDSLEGMALDGCGTAAVDEILGLLRRELYAKVSPQAWKIGYNLSPGGQIISIEEQRTIFSLLDGGKIGVELNESYLMRPVKSCSVIIPVGENLVMSNESFCTTCELCSGRTTCANSRFKTNAN